MNPQFDYCKLSDIDDLFLKLPAGLFYDFLDPCRVYSAICYESLKTQPGYFPPEGIKAGKKNGLRSIIYDEVNSCGSFNCTDVASFPANDLALYFITFKVKNSNGIFNCLFSSSSLNALNDNFPGFLISLLARIIYDFLLN